MLTGGKRPCVKRSHLAKLPMVTELLRRGILRLRLRIMIPGGQETGYPDTDSSAQIGFETACMMPSMPMIWART
jgi:hypothetical protein